MSATQPGVSAVFQQHLWYSSILVFEHSVSCNITEQKQPSYENKGMIVNVSLSVYFTGLVMAGIFSLIICLGFCLALQVKHVSTLVELVVAWETTSEKARIKKQTSWNVENVVSGHLWSDNRRKYRKWGEQYLQLKWANSSLIIITELQFFLE